MSAMGDYEIWLEEHGQADSEASRDAYKASLGPIRGPVMTVTASDLYALGLAVGSLLRGHVDPARQDRVLDLIRTLERQAAGGAAPNGLTTGPAHYHGMGMGNHPGWKGHPKVGDRDPGEWPVHRHDMTTGLTHWNQP